MELDNGPHYFVPTPTLSHLFFSFLFFSLLSSVNSSESLGSFLCDNHAPVLVVCHREAANYRPKRPLFLFTSRFLNEARLIRQSFAFLTILVPVYRVGSLHRPSGDLNPQTVFIL